MKKLVLLVSAFCLTVGVANAYMLSNGSLEFPGDGSPATGWTSTAIGGGWANTEVAGWGSGSYHFAFGHWGAGGGGMASQTVAASAGIEYTLTADSGADTWFLPTARMSMFFLDAGNAVVGTATRLTVDPAVYGSNADNVVDNPNPDLDIAHPWQNYSLSGLAPAGTTQIMVQLESNENSWKDYAAGDPLATGATGSSGFDNIVLVPEPTTGAFLALGSLALLGYRSRRNR